MSSVGTCGFLFAWPSHFGRIYFRFPDVERKPLPTANYSNNYSGVASSNDPAQGTRHQRPTSAGQRKLLAWPKRFTRHPSFSRVRQGETTGALLQLFYPPTWLAGPCYLAAPGGRPCRSSPRSAHAVFQAAPVLARMRFFAVERGGPCEAASQPRGWGHARNIGADQSFEYLSWAQPESGKPSGAEYRSVGL
jgi:hypothetical protein